MLTTSIAMMMLMMMMTTTTRMMMMMMDMSSIGAEKLQVYSCTGKKKVESKTTHEKSHVIEHSILEPRL